jgi:hypothetical protein
MSVMNFLRCVFFTVKNQLIHLSGSALNYWEQLIAIQEFSSGLTWMYLGGYQNHTVTPTLPLYWCNLQ